MFEKNELKTDKECMDEKSEEKTDYDIIGCIGFTAIVSIFCIFIVANLFILEEELSKKTSNNLSANTPNWVDIQNTADKKVYFDENIIYRYGKSIVYTIKTKKDNKTEYIQIELTDNKASFLSEGSEYKKTYEINAAEKKYFDITANKAIYDSAKIISAKKNIKNCPPSICINHASNIDWAPYMKELEDSIKKNWTPPELETSKQIIITFTIDKNGKLLHQKIKKSSNSFSADMAARKAITLTAPFKPLPVEFKGKSVEIEFTFDYNVLKNKQ